MISQQFNEIEKNQYQKTNLLKLVIYGLVRRKNGKVIYIYIYSDQQEISIDKSIILYASWIKIPVNDFSFSISNNNINYSNFSTNDKVTGSELDDAPAIKGLLLTSNNDAFTYSGNFSGIGWETTNTNEKLEANANLEAIKIELKAPYASQYDISYRVKTKGFGWLEYAANGKEAGNEGYGDYIQAIQIKIEPKQTKTVSSKKNQHTLIQKLNI